jgi:ectoine hydroxylase
MICNILVRMQTTLPAPALLTDAQREAFDRDGYLIIKGALDAEAVAYFLGVLRDIEKQERPKRGLTDDAFLEVRHAIHADHRVLDLLMWPSTFPLVAELMGPDLALTTSHALVRPPQPTGTPATFKGSGWHRDAHSNVAPVHGTCPWIYTKIGYFLSDLSRPDMGNLRVIPGSHRKAALPPTREGDIDPEGAIQVLAEVGDAVIFQQRLWHAVGPNFAPHARENFYLGYCYRWVRPIDTLPTPPELMAKADPCQRQLLGEVKSECTFYLPKPDDVPLRDWLENVRGTGNPPATPAAADHGIRM